MKNKGYTLIEVIGVLIILSFIIIIAVPTISKSLKSSKNRAYLAQLNEIEVATKSWVLLNGSNVPQNDGGTITISLLQLKLANLIPYDFKNTKTSELFPDDMQITITKQGMNLLYDVLDDTGTSNEIINPNAPQLILNGGITQVVQINGAYNELGATAKDNQGNSLSVSKTITNSSGLTVASISTSALGKYTITYSATKNNLTSTIRRIVKIKDTVPPTITISGYTNNQYINFEAKQGYALPNASVTDNSGSASYTVSGNFSPSVLGVKQAIYTAIDGSGNKSEFVLNYNVVDTTIPTMSISNSVNAITGRKVITVNATDNGSGLHELAYSFDNGNTWKKENTYVFEGTFNSTIIVRDKAFNRKSQNYVVN